MGLVGLEKRVLLVFGVGGRVEPDPLRFSLSVSLNPKRVVVGNATTHRHHQLGRHNRRRRAPARKMNLLHRLASSPLHLPGRAPPALSSPSEAFVVPPSRRPRLRRRWSVSASVSSSSAFAAAAEVEAEPVVVASEINGGDEALNGEDEKVVLPTNQTSERLLRIRHTVCHLPFSHRLPAYCCFCLRFLGMEAESILVRFFSRQIVHQDEVFHVSFFSMNLSCFDLEFTYALTFHLSYI